MYIYAYLRDQKIRSHLNLEALIEGDDVEDNFEGNEYGLFESES